MSAITIAAIVLVIHGGRKRRMSAVFQKAVSIAAIARSFLSGATVLQMCGSCDAVLSLQICRRLYRSASHLSVGVIDCLVGSGGGAGAFIWKGCCIEI